MKLKLLIVLLLTVSTLLAQKPCEYTTNVKDSLGILKETKPYLVHEKVFGNSAVLIFLSLISNDGTPLLSLKLIQKNTEFISPKCLDKDSKIYFQLANGKIYTFLSSDNNICDNYIYNEVEKTNNRILNANFLFRKDNFDDLKKYPIIMMRIKYSMETTDYIIPKALIAEKIEGKFEAENFFVNNFACIEN